MTMQKENVQEDSVVQENKTKEEILLKEGKIKIAVITNEETVMKHFNIINHNNVISFHIGKTTFAVEQDELKRFLE